MPRRSESYLQERRDAIMDAAVTCFARDGLHRTTMREIVAETGLSAGALYRYFPAKEDLVSAIAQRHHDEEAAALQQAAQAPDLRTALAQIARTLLGRLADPAEQRWRRVTVQMWGEALRDPEVMRPVRAGLEGPLELLEDLIRRAQPDGETDASADPRALARVYASVFQGLVLQQTWEPELDVDAYLDAALTLIPSNYSPS